MQRWRLGIPRLAEEHPYASLLIGDHAYWLYAAQFIGDAPPEFIHALQRDRKRYPHGWSGEARRFMDQVKQMQDDLCRRGSTDSVWRSALAPEHRFPHARLLQTLDALSLALCSDVLPAAEGGPARGLGEDVIRLADVPRMNWQDRVSIRLQPAGERRIRIEPYPFDAEPFAVSVPVRIVTTQRWWREAPMTVQTFTFVRT
jgi:hypothetical protein